MQIDDATLQLFRESLTRVTESELFFELFYDRFMAESEETRTIFQDSDMEHIQNKLKMTLQMVTDTANGLAGQTMYMELLGRIHARLNINREQFEQWRNALINTAAECDPQFDAGIRKAWESTIDQVIVLMFDND